MRRRVALVLAAAAVVLAGCSGAPSHGKIIGKRYEGPYTYSTLNCVAYRTVISMKGIASTQCSLWLPVPHSVGPKWYLDLKTSQHQGYHQVTSAEYATFSVGQQYG